MKNGDYDKFQKAIKYLVENIESQPSLADLSSFIGMSEYHCHRMFKKWVGVTPKDFLQTLTLAKAKKLLGSSKSHLDASFTEGLAGTSCLRDLFVSMELMTPRQYKRGGDGLKIYWDHFDAPLGHMALGKTERGICSLFFSKSRDKKTILNELKKRWPKAYFEQDSERTKLERTEICSRMAGKTNKKINLFVGGTAFQVTVWQALLSILEGEVATYKKIAEAIGKPNATRAVGTAIGANPIGFMIPCHRVIQSSGAIGHYHWGSDKKSALLAVEHARAHANKQS